MTYRYFIGGVLSAFCCIMFFMFFFCSYSSCKGQANFKFGVGTEVKGSQHKLNAHQLTINPVMDLSPS